MGGGIAGPPCSELGHQRPRAALGHARPLPCCSGPQAELCGQGGEVDGGEEGRSKEVARRVGLGEGGGEAALGVG
jgi:hypothetical protein